MPQIIRVKTGSRVDMLDITPSVQQEISKAGVQEGICMVYVPHTTAGVTINEGADPAVCQDIMAHFSEQVPHRGNYRHYEGNSDAHIKVVSVGSSETIVIQGGQLRLGTWQRIFFCEFDGPRTRSVWVKAVGVASARE